MVTSAGTRNVVSAEDLRLRVHDEDEQIAPALVDEALDRLERESKLVRRERRRDLYLYEITSEFLVPWISRRREELRLVQARRRERRRLRTLRTIAGGLLIIATLVAGIAVWALGQRDEAQRQRAEAQRQAANATSLALATSSAEPLETRPDVSLALAYEAYRESPREEAGSAVIQALIAARRSGLRGVLSSSELLSGVAVGPDGKLLATAGNEGVRLWDLSTRSQLGRLGTGPVDAVAFSPDGKMLATAGAGGIVRLWHPATRRQLGRLAGGTNGVARIAFSPDGSFLAIAAGDGAGDVLVSASNDGTVCLWNPATGEQLARLTGHDGWVTGVAFSRDGKTLASAGHDGTPPVESRHAQAAGLPQWSQQPDLRSGVRSRRQDAAFGRLRRRGASVESGHAQAARRAHRPHRPGLRSRVWSRRHDACFGEPRRRGAPVAPRHAQAARCAHRPQRPGLCSGLQSRRQDARVGQRRCDGPLVEPCYAQAARCAGRPQPPGQRRRLQSRRQDARVGRR